MSEISFLNAYSINPYSNAELKKKFQRHKSRIEEINKKASQFSGIEQEQLKIIEVVHRSKELSRKFQAQEFRLRKSIEDKRMINHLSRVESRKASAIEEAEEALLNRKKTTAKDEIMRHFEIQLEDRSRSEHLQEYFVDRRKYRKKIKREISEYERLREHMQRFKNAKPNLTRASSRAGADLSASPSKKNKRSKDRYLFKSGRKS